jgi:hypothetical protein
MENEKNMRPRQSECVSDLDVMEDELYKKKEEKKAKANSTSMHRLLVLKVALRRER